MENKFLIDISIKYGLDTAEVSKLADMVYQCGFTDIDDRKAQRVANYLCEMKLLDLPPEEVIEELKRKGFYEE
ncbi:MAG: hypothetical protein V1679_01000 [Candidatus Peregrinibacteria bacterium]